MTPPAHPATDVGWMILEVLGGHYGDPGAPLGIIFGFLGIVIAKMPPVFCNCGLLGIQLAPFWIKFGGPGSPNAALLDRFWSLGVPLGAFGAQSGRMTHSPD